MFYQFLGSWSIDDLEAEMAHIIFRFYPSIFLKGLRRTARYLSLWAKVKPRTSQIQSRSGNHFTVTFTTCEFISQHDLYLVYLLINGELYFHCI